MSIVLYLISTHVCTYQHLMSVLYSTHPAVEIETDNNPSAFYDHLYTIKDVAAFTKYVSI